MILGNCDIYNKLIKEKKNIIEEDQGEMATIQRKHTHNRMEEECKKMGKKIIDDAHNVGRNINLRKRSDKEIADYCLKKYTDIYLENIHLKKKVMSLSNKMDLTSNPN